MKRFFMNAKAVIASVLMTAIVSSSVVSCQQYDDTFLKDEINNLKQELADGHCTHFVFSRLRSTVKLWHRDSSLISQIQPHYTIIFPDAQDTSGKKPYGTAKGTSKENNRKKSWVFATFISI